MAASWMPARCSGVESSLRPDARGGSDSCDGRGDEGKCGDQYGDGRNIVSALVAINTAICTPALVAPICDGHNDGRCNGREEFRESGFQKQGRPGLASGADLTGQLRRGAGAHT